VQKRMILPSCPASGPGTPQPPPARGSVRLESRSCGVRPTIPPSGRVSRGICGPPRAWSVFHPSVPKP
jgi:hypothetical protein